MDSITNENNKLLKIYLQSLNPDEIIALKIAKEHLKSSFDIEKSIGFLQFLKNQ